MLTGKVCTKCGEWKKFEEFHKKKTTADGYQYYCKECCKKYKRKYYDSNRKEIIEKTRIYKQENHEKLKDKIKETNKEYYRTHSMEILEKQRKYTEKHHEHVKEIKRKSYHKNKNKVSS
jgi:hypothetical protein